ncbi:MAG: thioredoxin family protein [candidate division WOR-3 bacterium]
MIEKIKVKGIEVGIKGLKEIFEIVKGMNISEEEKKKEILKRVKSENYIPSEAEKDFEESLWKEFRRYLGEKIEDEESPFMEIKVIGAGCPRCKALLEETKNALTELGMSVNLEYVTDIREFSKYGVMVTPALIINKKIVSSGKVLKKEEIKKLILQFKK